MANTPVRIIIEGSNYCGKDAILDALALLCKNAVVVTTRGYWRRALMEKGLTRDDLLAYFKNRALSYLAVARAVQHDELIFVRLHLTDIVYSELYLQAQQDYGELEDTLNELTIGLVLLDVDDANTRSTPSRISSWNLWPRRSFFASSDPKTRWFPEGIRCLAPHAPALAQ